MSIAPEDLTSIAALAPPDAALIQKARASLVRIKAQSELADLWDEANAKADWLETINQIEQAL